MPKNGDRLPCTLFSNKWNDCIPMMYTMDIYHLLYLTTEHKCLQYQYFSLARELHWLTGFCQLSISSNWIMKNDLPCKLNIHTHYNHYRLKSIFQYISNFFCCNNVSIHRPIICQFNIHYGLQYFRLKLVKIYYVHSIQNQLPVCITMWQEKTCNLNDTFDIKLSAVQISSVCGVVYLPYN